MASKVKASVSKHGAPRRTSAGERAPVGVEDVLGELRARATAKTLAGMKRYGLPSEHAWGVAVGDIREVAKEHGRDHALALALWGTGVYEARMLAAFVDDPERVTIEQMDRWCDDFDNWGICDTVCFHLFDRTPYAFDRITAWADRSEEFVRRAAFALLASVALHDAAVPDDAFLACMPLIERAATDPRNFVKKGVSWALRGVGRRNGTLHEAAVTLAERLSAAKDPAARWVGKDAARELTSTAVRERVQKNDAKRSSKAAKATAKKAASAKKTGKKKAQREDP